MTVLRTLIAIVGVAATVACNGDDIAGPQDFARLAQAQAKWAARPFADYSFEIRTFCFCPPEINRWTRVSVRNGAVVDAQPVETDPAFPIETIQWWKPIDTLFVNLERAMRQPDLTGYLASIEVEYDPELGYPTLIEYRAKPNVADGGSTISVRSVMLFN